MVFIKCIFYYLIQYWHFKNTKALYFVCVHFQVECITQYHKPWYYLWTQVKEDPLLHQGKSCNLFWDPAPTMLGDKRNHCILSHPLCYGCCGSALWGDFHKDQTPMNAKGRVNLVTYLGNRFCKKAFWLFHPNTDSYGINAWAEISRILEMPHLSKTEINRVHRSSKVG